MNNGPYGPTPPPYDPSGQPPQPWQQAPLVQSSYGGPGSGGDDTLAWVSVGLSSAGWLSCCCGPIPFLGIIGALGGFAFSVGGAICGFLAWQKAKRQSTRTDIAMVGMVLGISKLAVFLLLLIAGAVLLALGIGGAMIEQIMHPQ